MNYKFKYFIVGLVILTLSNKLFGQKIQISNNLVLYKISKHCYKHTQKRNNGLVYINDRKAIIISTPDSDIETQNLIDWVQNQQQAKIVAYVIDRWHPDAIQGLDIVKKNGIKSYAYKMTRKIAEEKGLPIPDVGFNLKKEIKIKNEKIVCHFLGEAHTSDGIVVWIPSDQVLFGGNGIRNNNGWIGNIGDANLKKWSETAKNIKNEYGSAKIVVPGHGKCGGSELIDYTIDLYKIPKNELYAKRKIIPSIEIKAHKELNIQAEYDSIQSDKRILKNAVVIIQDKTKIIEIKSPQIKITQSNGRIDSESGIVRIFDKRAEGQKLRIDVNYKKIIVYKYDNDFVGFVVILKEITTTNI